MIARMDALDGVWWNAVEATIVTVTGSKYDTRGFVAEDDFTGCFLTGCLPELTTVSLAR